MMEISTQQLATFQWIISYFHVGFFLNFPLFTFFLCLYLQIPPQQRYFQTKNKLPVSFPQISHIHRFSLHGIFYRPWINSLSSIRDLRAILKCGLASGRATPRPLWLSPFLITPPLPHPKMMLLRWKRAFLFCDKMEGFEWMWLLCSRFKGSEMRLLYSCNGNADLKHLNFYSYPQPTSVQLVPPLWLSFLSLPNFHPVMQLTEFFPQ